MHMYSYVRKKGNQETCTYVARCMNITTMNTKIKI